MIYLKALKKKKLNQVQPAAVPIVVQKWQQLKIYSVPEINVELVAFGMSKGVRVRTAQLSYTIILLNAAVGNTILL